MFNVVLVQPEIPQNTGNIGRLTAGCRAKLHLIHPLGFSLSDKHLRRAGLDYWPEVQLADYPDWKAFEGSDVDFSRMWLFSTKAERPYTEITFKPGDTLVFGAESKGLPQELHERYRDQRYRIPIENPNIRSLNLANAVAVVLYEALRQLR
ncbi:MAG: tRNA (cytidine(34)-2'-O)-methyltransferase [Bdellovibrionales bacterium]|nr:tRNA (cytidine(34)-2'-O)-methyltransferase [Bdellovibrionales bacterium]